MLIAIRAIAHMQLAFLYRLKMVSYIKQQIH
jgi:hypothetical protein